MRQRAMIAMALSCHPSLLIADEPTTALDVTTEAQILELMRKLQNELGMAIMFITHNLGVIAEMADQVAVMYLGEVVENTSVDALFAMPCTLIPRHCCGRSRAWAWQELGCRAHRGYGSGSLQSSRWLPFPSPLRGVYPGPVRSSAPNDDDSAWRGQRALPFI